MNSDLKKLTNWLNANKISLTESRIGLVIFKPKKKHMYFDKKLNWKAHIDDVAIKLIRANAMLHKTRDFVNRGILKLIYFALFDSNINYVSIIWGQTFIL